VIAPRAFQPTYVWLDTPFDIFVITTDGAIRLVSQQVQAFNSTVKVTLRSGASSGSDEVVFAFFWENQSDRYVLLNADGFVGVKGVCQAFAHGGFFPDDRHSRLSLDVQLNLLELWNDPPTSPPFETDQSENAGRVYAEAGGWWDPGDIESVNVNRGYDLDYTFFIVPPQSGALFELAVTMSYDNSDGEAIVDFAFEDFAISGFAVLLAVLT
jgi:hypothetical protein